MNILEEIKDNEVSQQMIDVLKRKNILFLESDHTLSSAVGNFQIFLRESKIDHNCLFNLRELPISYIKDIIDWYDVIVFETTWTYEISRQLEAYLLSLKQNKIIIECYIADPSYYYKPEKTVHDIYVLKSYSDDMDDWKFNLLRVDKPIWEK